MSSASSRGLLFCKSAAAPGESSVGMAVMSYPVENAFSELPVMTTQRTKSFSAQLFNVKCSSAKSSGVREFPLSGRLSFKIPTLFEISLISTSSFITDSFIKILRHMFIVL